MSTAPTTRASDLLRRPRHALTHHNGSFAAATSLPK